MIGTWGKAARRTGVVLAGTAALTMGLGSSAWAHHCYKDAWQEAASEQLAEGGTAWMPMSDFVGMMITIFGGSSDCVAHADDWVAAWMTANEVEDEPLIHMKATVGGGAKYMKDYEPAPFEYLGDEEFGFLVGQVLSTPGCEAVEFPTD